MSEWRDAVREELDRFRRDTGSAFVSRQELLDQALARFERRFPDAKTPGQTMSRVLQELGERDEITLYGDGLYEIHTLAYEHGQPDVTSDSDGPTYHANEYETVVGARSVPASFREAMLTRYGQTCPVSGVDHPGVLDIAHVLPWADHPTHRVDPQNVVVLDRTHHAAFDRDLFTLDSEFKLRLDPSFETDSATLQRTLVDAAGSTVSLPAPAAIDPSYLAERNEAIEWFPA